MNRTCYFFIDGIDHAARSIDTQNSFLAQLPQPEELCDGIKFVLVGQPINGKYPIWLQSSENVDRISLPPLEKDDVATLLESLDLCNHDIDTDTLSDAICSVVGSNALNILFAFYEIQKIPSPLSFDKIIAVLNSRKLNCQISKYYEWITGSQRDSLAFMKIATIFAVSSRKIPSSALSDLCGLKDEEVVFALNKMYPLVISDKLGYFSFHNDVRLFFKDLVKSDLNLPSIVHSIYKNIMSHPNLQEFEYDILVELLFIVRDTNSLLEVFTPQYIIQSTLFNISIDKLLIQFRHFSTLVSENNMDSLGKISIIGAALSQYISCIQYNEKESEYIEEKKEDRLTKSEKYILDSTKQIHTIVYDVYTLLENRQLPRAKRLFDEHLSSFNLYDYFSVPLKTDSSFYFRCGYISRFFNVSILHDEPYEGNNTKYLQFVSGWLKASKEYTAEPDIAKTFSFIIFVPKDLLHYIENICKFQQLSLSSYSILAKKLISDSSIPISSLIELCSSMLLNRYPATELQSAISQRLYELLDDDSFEFNVDRIPCCVKALFCIYQNDSYPQWFNLYNKILNSSHNSISDRGYHPAMAQKDLAITAFSLFYSNDISEFQITELVINIGVFIRQYGSGCSYDCKASSVLSFLKNVIYNYFYNNPSDARLPSICNVLYEIFTCSDPIYINEYALLFQLAEEKDLFLKIADFWCGETGVLWQCDYDTVEYHCESVISILKHFNEAAKAEEISRRNRMKLLGYAGHKDYSVGNLLDLYECIPLSSEKLIQDGMMLLTISDAASEIGDNRCSSSIDHALFNVAVSLGPQYLSALFELKNNPKDFLYWRDCLLEALCTRVSELKLSDSALLAIYKLNNSWINVKIEAAKQYNRLENLYTYNSILINSISDKDLKVQLIRKGNCTPSQGKIDIPHKTESSIPDLSQELCLSGYSSSFEERLCAFLSNDRRIGAAILIDIKDKIPVESRPSFVSKHVVNHIIKTNQYGYSVSNLLELLREYSSLFSQQDWLDILSHSIARISPANYENFYFISNDIETLALLYYNIHSPQNIKSLFTEKCNMHKLIISSCQTVAIQQHSIKPDTDVMSYEDFVKKQLG